MASDRTKRIAMNTEKRLKNVSIPCPKIVRLNATQSLEAGSAMLWHPLCPRFGPRCAPDVPQLRSRLAPDLLPTWPPTPPMCILESLAAGSVSAVGPSQCPQFGRRCITFQCRRCGLWTSQRRHQTSVKESIRNEHQRCHSFLLLWPER